MENPYGVRKILFSEWQSVSYESFGSEVTNNKVSSKFRRIE